MNNERMRSFSFMDSNEELWEMLKRSGRHFADISFSYEMSWSAKILLPKQKNGFIMYNRWTDPQNVHFLFSMKNLLLSAKRVKVKTVIIQGKTKKQECRRALVKNQSGNQFRQRLHDAMKINT